MAVRRVSIPVSKEQPQPTKVSFKALENDLDDMVVDINNHMETTITRDGTETLTNKTMNTTTMNSPAINSPVIGTPIITGQMASTAGAWFNALGVPPAGGATSVGIKATSTPNLGVFFGSGEPTLSAAQGSLYIRTDGSSSNNRFYINTNGFTDWTPGTTDS